MRSDEKSSCALSGRTESNEGSETSSAATTATGNVGQIAKCTSLYEINALRFDTQSACRRRKLEDLVMKRTPQPTNPNLDEPLVAPPDISSPTLSSRIRHVILVQTCSVFDRSPTRFDHSGVLFPFLATLEIHFERSFDDCVNF
jgi:hypothetical protein